MDTWESSFFLSTCCFDCLLINLWNVNVTHVLGVQMPRKRDRHNELNRNHLNSLIQNLNNPKELSLWNKNTFIQLVLLIWRRYFFFKNFWYQLTSDPWRQAWDPVYVCSWTWLLFAGFLITMGGRTGCRWQIRRGGALRFYDFARGALWHDPGYPDATTYKERNCIIIIICKSTEEILNFTSFIPKQLKFL